MIPIFTARFISQLVAFSPILLVAALSGCTAESPHGGHADEDVGPHRDEGPGAGDEGHDDSIVALSPAAISRSGIKVTLAKGGLLGGGVEVPAEIALAPDQIAHVTLLVPGRIARVKKTLGDKVRAGDVIAVVESAELGATLSARTQAEAEVTVARKAFERQSELKAAGIGTERTWDEAASALQRAEAVLEAATQRARVYGSGGGTSTTIALRAPLDGEIVERHASVGEVAQAGGEPLFVVANLDHCVVSMRVYERDVGVAVVGAPIRLTLHAYPGASWEAVVDYVSPRLDERTRTLLVRATLQNDGRLKPGLFGSAALLPLPSDSDVVDEVSQHAIVPADAVQRMPTGPAVFVPGDVEGTFRMVPVVLGGRRGGEVELVMGLAAGDAVVVEGAFVLKSEHQRGELGEGHAH